LLRTDEPLDDLPKSQAEIDENIFQVFKGEIEKGKITMSIVRDKIKTGAFFNDRPRFT